MPPAKKKIAAVITEQFIVSKIYWIRGQKVMLDKDLAQLYEVETKVLNQSVKRNAELFPEDFMFRLNDDEWNSLRSQIMTLEAGRGKYSKYSPLAFTDKALQCCQVF